MSDASPSGSGSAGGPNHWRSAVTSDEINALPERVRKHIHDLVTGCDPAGEVQERWPLREQREGLVARVRELEAQLAFIANRNRRGS